MTFTAAARRCAALAVACLLGGLLLGRPDVAALAAPFVVGLAAALRRPGGTPPSVRVQASPATVHEGGAVEVVVTLEAPEPLDVAVLTVASSGFTVASGGTRVATALGSGQAAYRLVLTAGWWGRRRVGPVTCAVTTGLGAHRRVDPVVAAALPVAVLPAVEPFAAADAVPRAVAYSGAHRARSIGPGAEFAAIRPFAAGDSARRINWPASLRAGGLLTNLATTERAARVWILLDSQYTGGRQGRALLDVAVRAAAGIADHYLAVGDSVGLAEYGGRNRVLPAGAGGRQRALVHDWLLDVGPISAARPPADGLFASLRTSGALVAALTPLLDEVAAARLVQLRRSGASVVAVDTLVGGALPADGTPAGRIARELWLLERRSFLDPLTDLGVPVVRWDGPGTLDTALAELARMAAAPRAVLR